MLSNLIEWNNRRKLAIILYKIEREKARLRGEFNSSGRDIMHSFENYILGINGYYLDNLYRDADALVAKITWPYV